MGPCLSSQNPGEEAFRNDRCDSLENMSAKIPLMKAVSTPLPMRRTRVQESTEAYKSRLERPAPASFGFRRQISIPQTMPESVQSLDKPSSNLLNVVKQEVHQSDTNSNYSSTTSSEVSKLPTMQSKLKPPSSFKRCLSQETSASTSENAFLAQDTNGNTKHSSRLMPPQAKLTPKLNIPIATNELLSNKPKAPVLNESSPKMGLKPSTSLKYHSKSQDLVTKHSTHVPTTSLENVSSPHASLANKLGLKKPENAKSLLKYSKLRQPNTPSKSSSTNIPTESKRTCSIPETKVKATLSSHNSVPPDSASSPEDSGIATAHSDDRISSSDAQQEPSTSSSAISTSYQSKRSQLTLRYMPKSPAASAIPHQSRCTTVNATAPCQNDSQCIPLKVNDVSQSKADVCVGFVQLFQLYPSQAEMAILSPALDFDQQQGILLEEISPMDYPSSMSSSCNSSSAEKQYQVADGFHKTTQDGISSPTPTSYSEAEQNFLIDDEIADQPELMLDQGRDGVMLEPSDLHLRLCAVRSDSKDTLSPCESLASDEIEWSEQQRVLRHRGSGPETPQDFDVNFTPKRPDMRSPRISSLTQLGLPSGEWHMGGIDTRVEELDRGYLAQDVQELKAMLLKLRSVLEDAETGALYRRLAANADSPRDVDSKHCRNGGESPETLDLKRQVVFLQEQLEDKNRTVKNLQQQLKVVHSPNHSKDKSSKKSNVATQTERPRISVTEAVSGSPSSDDILGPLVRLTACKEARSESQKTKISSNTIRDEITLECPEKKPLSMSPRKPIPIRYSL